MWRKFSDYHYLSHSLQPSARSYVAERDGDLIGFVAITQMVGYAGVKLISRIVVLPDYQGIGLGTKLATAAARMTFRAGKRVVLITSNPLLRHILTPKRGWILKHRGRTSTTNANSSSSKQDLEWIERKKKTDAHNRRTCSFWYVGEGDEYNPRMMRVKSRKIFR